MYEAADVMNLANWSQVVRGPVPCFAFCIFLLHLNPFFSSRQTEFNIKMAEDSKCMCLSWSTSRRFPPFIALGCKNNSAHALQLWRFNGTKCVGQAQWWRTRSLVSVRASLRR